MKRFLSALLFLGVSAFGQSASTDGTSNTFVAAIECVGVSTTSCRTIQVFLTVGYADTATEDQYVDVTNFRQDATAAINAVSNKNAPLEVFSAAVLNSLFVKYTQVQSMVVQVGFQSQTVNQQEEKGRHQRGKQGGC